MKTKRIPLFNPLSSTFSCDWRDDNNDIHELIMYPVAITYFTPPQADFMVKHLTDAVMNSRGLNGINNKKEIDEIIKLIRVQV